MAESKVFTVQFWHCSGHGVPRGSQVRLNLQTGQREVKLGEHQTLKYQIDGQRYELRILLKFVYQPYETPSKNVAI